jgi:acyl phosphate:glycerol-3-phosphate acyltransferase
MILPADPSQSLVYVVLAAALVGSYLLGSVPVAYVIVKLVSGEDITRHGTGNVGSMNVRRTTGSWTWFSLAVLGDGLKGLLPVVLAKGAAGGFAIAWILTPAGVGAGALGYDGPSAAWALLLPEAALLGSVLGHNYSAWMALIERRFAQSGKGLATGAGALLAYDWRYFLAVLLVGLAVIALTRYFMAGQVAATLTLPATAIVLRSPDWPFALVMAAIVYAAHHRRFVGMLQGREPKLYRNDRSERRG